MSILLTIHSINRWLLTLVALALIIRLIVGLAKKQSFNKSVTILTGAFGGLMDLQLLLGALFLVMDGLAKAGFPSFRWEHAIIMLIAALVAHLPAMWKNKEDHVRTRNTLIAVIISLLFVFLGMNSLGGWARWWHIAGLF